MRKNENKVPEFDDIIFENRNKAYGGYDLRRRYKSVTTLSVLGGVALSTLLMLLLSFSSNKEASAEAGNGVIVIIKPDNTLIQEKVKPVEPEKATPEPVQNKYSPPDVVDDTSIISTQMPSIDDVLRSAKNGSVTEIDTFVYVPAEEIPAEPEPYYSVEEMPAFPGGEAALLKFIADNTKYPAEAELNNIQGKVILKFAVEPDGSVNRITVLRQTHPLLDEEAVRVIKSLKGWTPGKQNGKPVPVWYVLPVNFQLRVDN
jgi:periplasmic protein TonB